MGGKILCLMTVLSKSKNQKGVKLRIMRSRRKGVKRLDVTKQSYRGGFNERDDMNMVCARCNKIFQRAALIKHQESGGSYCLSCIFKADK